MTRSLQEALHGPGQWGRSPRASAAEWRSLAVLPVRLLAWLAQVLPAAVPLCPVYA